MLQESEGAGGLTCTMLSVPIYCQFLLVVILFLKNHFAAYLEPELVPLGSKRVGTHGFKQALPRTLPDLWDNSNKATSPAPRPMLAGIMDIE